MRILSVFFVMLGGCAAPVGPAPVEGTAALGRGVGPGCTGSAYGGIQAAIDAAVAGDVVEVCPGTYPERLSIGKDLTLLSTDGAAVTTIDATWGGSGLAVSGGAVVVVAGFTFRSGSSSGIGGNVRCEDATLELRDSVLIEGSASQGGGAGLVRCAGVVDGNTFRDNEASADGGGLFAVGSVAVLDNRFEDNRADDGGAAYLRDSVAVVGGNTLLANLADNDGGGIYVDGGSPLVDGNVFEDNEAEDDGGGLRVKLAAAVVTNNVFTENHADFRGGAMRVSHLELVSMSGNTYVENSADGTGGAVLLYESASTLRDETYVGNTAEKGGGLAIVAGWGPVVVEDSVFQGNVADDGGQVYVELPGHTTTLRRVDLAGGTAERGGGVYAVASGVALENVLLASNVAEDAGGALFFEGVTGHVTNTVAIGNAAPEGSALQIEAGVDGLEVVSTVFAGNTDGPAVEVRDGTAPDLRYDAFDGNDEDLSGLSDVIGVDGNLGVPAGFVDAPGGDYTLGPDSALRDAGDPEVLDVDGSRCDIGLHGGPGA